MAGNSNDTGAGTFQVQDGQLRFQPGDATQPAIVIAVVPGNPDIVSCTQAPAAAPGAVNLGLVVADGAGQKVLHGLVRNVGQLIATKTLSLAGFTNLIASAAPIAKVTHSGDGMFVSTHDDALHYAPVNVPSAQPIQLAAAGAGPLADVTAAKDAIALFLNNLCDQLPKMAAEIEKAASQEILNALGAEIKAQRQNLGKVFDKPLTSFIAQRNQGAPAQAASVAAPDADARRLLLRKLDVQRYLDPFAPAPAAAAPVQAGGGDPDPLEELGKLFAPFSTLLDARKLVSLLGMGVSDLLEAVSGSKPFASVIGDFFDLFKIDDAMTALHDVFSSGRFSALIGQLGPKAALQRPVENAFFIALYAHYYPGKTFTVGDLVAFLGALVGFVAFEAQGKESEFQAIFTDQQSLNEFTNAPATLVALIGGAPPPSPTAPPAVAAMTLGAMAAGSGMPLAAPQPPAPPPPWRVDVAAALSGITTFGFGVCGVLSFGTGLIASPIVGGIAAGVSQCAFGMLKNYGTDDWKWDLLSGFAGGFSGAFVATLLGNKLFAGWAQRGATPSARIQKLRLIMAGSALTLGGGGGAVVATLVKSYAKTGKIDFDDPLALVTGAVGGLGGGAMGCGLQFMGGLSGGACLPVPLSLAEANAAAMNALAGVQPLVMSNATPLAAVNGNFPAPLPAWSMGVAATEFQSGFTIPTDGLSVAFVKRKEFTDMDASYNGVREMLFWLEDVNGGHPATARIADLVIGLHGIGRYVFPLLTHRDPAGGDKVEFSRPMYKTDFAQFLAGQAYLTNYLNGVRAIRAPGLPIVKLMVCFSALPVGCCSLGQELATTLNATVYAGRPPVYPELENGLPQVPRLGGWIKYNP